MTPEQILPLIEGSVGYMLGSANATGSAAAQGHTIVTTWLEMIKVLLKSPNFRYLDDLQWTCSDDVDQSAEVVSASATHFIAGLIEVMGAFTTDGTGWVGWTDADTDTVDYSTTLGNDQMLLLHVGSVATAGQSEFASVIYPAGIGGSTDGTTTTYSDAGLSLSIGLCVSADGDDGTDIATDAVRIWTLFRT